MKTLIKPYKAAQYHFSTAARIPLTLKDLHPDPAYREVAGRLGMEAAGQSNFNYDLEIYQVLAAIDPATLQKSLSFGNGQLPEILLICNFPEPDSNNPGLMDIENVKTFFHEFGHLMHYLFYGQQPVPGGYEEDFAEAPSQLFEFWATNEGILKSFARHHETGKVIPEELLEQYFQAASFGRATEINALIGSAYSGLELYLHSPREKSIDEVMQESFRKYQVVDYPEDVHLAANFHHLVHMGPRFYTYLISGIIARDLFSAFDTHDLTESTVGERYKETLLSPTGTKSSLELVEDFLGRPYTYDAWKTWVAKR